MLEKKFDPKSFEQNFSFEKEASLRRPNAEPFMILLPPPNITGSLHIGHSLCYILQDILVRYKRLRGYDVLFQPGLDHAGIVTQLLVEKRLYESGIKKGNLTRESLLKEIWLWKENSGCLVLDQMKILGISCDFSRLRFTMDEDSQKAVIKMFVQLFNDGLIYKAEKMINWDSFIGSAISDLEIIEKEVNGHLYYIKYMLADSDGHITVATTRPETIFGDVAVAVNPEDSRYKDLIGKNVILPLVGRKIPIIADEYAAMDKGTGAVKITPAHDFNDFEVGSRHKLPIIDIMNDKCELNENVPEIFQKMDRLEARPKIVELLEKEGFVEKIESIKQMVPFGDRSGMIVEPRITWQWFVDAEKLATPAINAVKDGKIKFIPKHWENLYFEWLNNIKPWCISRQIWWGHRIPAWYGPDGHIFVEENMENAKKKAAEFYGNGEIELTQDEDVLDTWFSSGMWPFVTLGWPNKTEDLARYYSKMVIVTGFDIIFFWIARMIMMGIYATGEVPFFDVYIHGLVRDEKGQKMSKSKGNVINPLDLCEQYGTDAVRYTIASMSSPGRNIKMSSHLVETGRNFLTKLWNVVRFAQMNECVYNEKFEINKISSPIAKWAVFSVKNMVEDVERAIENYRFDETARHIYKCVWNSFCEWYMEFIKSTLQQDDSNLTSLKKEFRDTTAWAILQFIRVLYPIAPFISRKLSEELGVSAIEWPDLKEISIDFEKSVREVEFLKDIISAVRSMKRYLRIPEGEKLGVSIETTDSDITKFLSDNSEILYRMVGATIGNVKGQTVPIAVEGAIVHMGFEGKIDLDGEKKRLNDEISKLLRTRDEARARLENNDFLNKASEEVIQEHKDRISNINDKVQRIDQVIQSLEKTHSNL